MLIYMEGKPVEVTAPHGTLSGYMVLELCRVPHNYQLYIESPGAPDRMVPPEEAIDLRGDEPRRFFAVPPGTMAG